MAATVSYRDLKFREDRKQPKKRIRVDFMQNYYFFIDKENLERYGEVRVENGDLLMSCSQIKAENKVSRAIDAGFEDLMHRIRQKPAKYIHRNLGLPLIGTNEFGLVDRGSNIIEVKPVTGCNLSCVFCSISEGINDKQDLVVECEYLLEEFRKLADIKEHPVEANIGPQGEPLLYPKLVELVKGLKETPNVEVVSMNTNGLTLYPGLIDDLAEAGLDRMNMSMHADDPEKAAELMNGPYKIKRVKEMISYCEGKIDVLLAPVLIPGYNEDEMDGLVEYAKTITNERFPTIGIQNYLNYKGGRNIAEQMAWEDFYEVLEGLEKRHDVDLRMRKSTFEIKQDKTLPKPFRKGQRVDVELVEEGRKGNEMLGRAKGRAVTVLNSDKRRGVVSVKLIRDKHNIFTGVV